MRMPSQRSQASQLNDLLFEVAAVATPHIAYAFVTKKRSALHTFDRAGSDAGTRRETKSQLSRGSCLREKVAIHAQRFRNPYTPLEKVVVPLASEARVLRHTSPRHTSFPGENRHESGR
jgi:hypothetical protein